MENIEMEKIKCNEKDKLINWIKRNKNEVIEIYNKNIDYMNYLNITYDEFVLYCYLYS